MRATDRGHGPLQHVPPDVPLLVWERAMRATAASGMTHAPLRGYPPSEAVVVRRCA